MKSTGIIKKVFLYGILIGLLGIAAAYLGLRIWIMHDAHKIAAKAVAVFHKDKVESLLLCLDSDSFLIREKNDAIWALGAFKDKRALGKLESLVTHEKCSYGHLCQYEIQKAILIIKREYKALWKLDPRNYHTIRKG
jgi:hypothetical protein